MLECLFVTLSIKYVSCVFNSMKRIACDNPHQIRYPYELINILLNLNYCACIQLWINCYLNSDIHVYMHHTLLTVTPFIYTEL